MARYRFGTRMRFSAPIGAVYAALVEPEGWLGDWGDLVSVRRLADGADDGCGAAFSATVRAPIGYHLSADIEVHDTDRPRRLGTRATGQLEGDGRWELQTYPGGTDVRFTWDVRSTAAWMNIASPIARPLFERSHRRVVRSAAEAAARYLGAEVVAFDSFPVRRRRRRAVGAVAIPAVVLAVVARRRRRSPRSG